MNLIDKKELIEYLSEARDAGYVDRYTNGIRAEIFDEVLTCVSEQPTVDAVPVRHGKWIPEWETEDTRMLRCSECKMVFNVGKGRDGNYCPNCGTRMDAE